MAPSTTPPEPTTITQPIMPRSVTSIVIAVSGVIRVPFSVASQARAAVTPLDSACGRMLTVWLCPGSTVTTSESGTEIRWGLSVVTRTFTRIASPRSLVIVTGNSLRLADMTNRELASRLTCRASAGAPIRSPIVRTWSACPRSLPIQPDDTERASTPAAWLITSESGTSSP